jgi:hypothetical protein
MKNLLTFSTALLLVQAICSTVAAGGITVPLSWSPDSHWLSYTLVLESGQDQLRPGWLFDTDRDQIRAVARGAAAADRRSVGGAALFQIWATHRQSRASVLIEESRWPLSSPSWNPEGTAIAFGRFVPTPNDEHSRSERGRFEVVIQAGLDRKRVIWSSTDAELDAHTRATFPLASCAWSPDGKFLAIPRPGAGPAVEIVRIDTKKPVLQLDQALLPTWSPDCSTIAYVRANDDHYGLYVVEHHDESFTTPRPLMPIGPLPSRPLWASDSRSIFIVVDRTMARLREMEVERVFVDGGAAIRVHPLLSEQLRLRRPSQVRGVAIDCDREAERCVFSLDQEGQDVALVWGALREPENYKRFHPFDVTQRVGALAVSPDGATVALRFESSEGLTPPAICELDSEQISLLAPDEAARQNWLALLVGLGRALLVDGLPPATVGIHRAARPTLLPIAGELTDPRMPPPPPVPVIPPPPAFGHLAPGENALLRELLSQPPLDSRLARIGRLGSSLCEQIRERGDGALAEEAGTRALEARLFFSYLAGDLPKAQSSVEALERGLSSPEERLAAFSVRAQILWAQGEHGRARAMIDHLLAIQGLETTRIEETPQGHKLTKEVSPAQAWARYLSSRTMSRVDALPSVIERSVEAPDVHLGNPLRIPDGAMIEGGAARVPFVLP